MSHAQAEEEEEEEEIMEAVRWSRSLEPSIGVWSGLGKLWEPVSRHDLHAGSDSQLEVTLNSK